MKAFEDPNHEGNSKKYHTKKLCIEKGCPNIAGTAWSPFWCFKHNVERIRRINKKLEFLNNKLHWDDIDKMPNDIFDSDDGGY